jgi:SHS2 domain-containing protein
MFLAAADGTMNIMVADLETTARRAARTLQVEAENMEMLLFEILQDLTFYKDAERILLRRILYPGAKHGFKEPLGRSDGEGVQPPVSIQRRRRQEVLG